MALRYVDPSRPANMANRALMRFGRSRAGQLFARHVAARTDIWLGRVSSGRVNWGMFNVPSATLHTIGARSGEPRQVQIAYFHDNEDVVAIASNFGGANHPGWYYNLVAHPACTLGGEQFEAREVTDKAEYVARRRELLSHGRRPDRMGGEHHHVAPDRHAGPSARTGLGHQQPRL